MVMAPKEIMANISKITKAKWRKKTAASNAMKMK